MVVVMEKKRWGRSSNRIPAVLEAINDTPTKSERHASASIPHDESLTLLFFLLSPSHSYSYIFKTRTVIILKDYC